MKSCPGSETILVSASIPRCGGRVGTAYGASCHLNSFEVAHFLFEVHFPRLFRSLRYSDNPLHLRARFPNIIKSKGEK